MQTEFLRQDGTRLPLKVFGDDFYARTETLDGYTVVFHPDSRDYHYAVLSADGARLESSGLVAGQEDPERHKLPRHLSLPPAAAKEEAVARYEQWNLDTKTSELWESLKAQRRALDAPRPKGNSVAAPPSFPTIGNKVGLTLLIDFDNDPATIPRAEIVNFLNADNYNGYGNNGSVKKYFQDNSNSLLTYTNVVTVYVRIPNSLHPKSWYNDTTRDCGTQANLLMKDALDLLKAMPNYEADILPAFNNLTVDAGNNIQACNVYYAGGNGGVWAKGLWPHSWVLGVVGPQELSPGGMRVNKYQFTNIGASLQLGTFCHENGHMLCGYPDIYDYGYDSFGGAGLFCLMNSGGHGTNPAMICAYLKRAAGWTTETTVTSLSHLTGTLASAVGAAGYNHVYRYAKPGVPTEYFLFENRQSSGRDANLPASGIAVWHVDELGNRDDQSLVPNTTHANYEVTLVQADNLWHFQTGGNRGDVNDLYYLGNTAAGYANAFHDTSAPHAHWWDGGNSHLRVSAFSASGPSMTLQFGLSENTIQIASPNGGEQIPLGSTRTVTWAANTAGNVTIELFKGGVLHAVLSADEANDGSFYWAVEAGLPVGSDYTLRISSVANPAYTDASDASFALVSLPEIVVEQPEGNGLTDGVSSVSFGEIAVGASASLVFTVRNTGTTDLTNLAITKNGSHAASYTVGALGATTLAAGMSTSFTVTFSPDGGGARHAALQLASNDSDENPFDIDLTGSGPPISLADATDTTGLAWTTAGDAGWFGQSLTAHDAVDAAQSGAIGDSQSSSMQTPITGSGHLTFWWKVSSERGWDYLTLFVDDVEQTGSLEKISGEVDWVQKTVVIPTGSHVVKWVYEKDTSVAEGSDAAWVDQVVFTPVAMPEIVVEQPVGFPLTDGSSGGSFGQLALGESHALTFTVRNTGNADLTGLSVSRDGSDRADFTAGVPGATTLAPNESTTFTVTFSPLGGGPRSAVLHLASNDSDENPFDIPLVGAGPDIPIAEAVDTPGRAWAIEGDADWYGQASTTQDGVDAARSATITHRQVCGIHTSVSGPGTLTFWWKVSSEVDWDFLTLYLDEVEQTGALAKISGEVNWEQKTMAIPPGDHVLKWTYSKDFIDLDPIGSDAGWVDQVVFTPAIPEIVVEQPAGAALVDGVTQIQFGSLAVGAVSNLTFTIRNTGTLDLTGLGITIDGEDASLFTVTSTPVAPVPGPGGSTLFTVRFAPTVAGVRNAALHIASNDADENPFDIQLTGSRYTALENWRKNHFGIPGNTSVAANGADEDGDRIPNLVEFAFDLDPGEDSSGQLPTLQKVGNDYVITFIQPAGVEGVTYGAEWDTVLPMITPAPVSDTGVMPVHIFRVPADGRTRVYMRLTVTTP